ncbi:YopX family protein [Sporosarcina sp. FSL K6-2383]|uniref:YopX family protein n=1 Tax=Sporosarcina sp. FSL K6-2383 TaxID=2921556 RepID=UPI00315A9167
MREIKFRVFDTTTHDMYHPGEDGSQLIIGMSHALDGDRNYVALWSDEGEICREGDAEFMQYTGLKDKDGREIYEDDIVEFGAGPYQVVYEKGCHYVHTPHDSEFLHVIKESYIEIIGNIHSNPELLEVAE